MEESTYREGSTSTITLKKKSLVPAHAIYHKFSLLRPDLQKGMGMPFFFSIFFNSHQVLDINKFISSLSLPLIFILTKFTSMRWHRDVGILDIIVCHCSLLGRSHYDCCWDVLLLLFIMTTYETFFIITEGLDKSSFCF